MPDLDTSIHLDMWRAYRGQHSPRRRVHEAFRTLIRPRSVYGYEWGDPEAVPPLRFVRDRYVLPYIACHHNGLEIGPGGGRWTRYLLGFYQLYLVDYHSELLGELRKNFETPNMKFIKNNGCDFPMVPKQSIDFVFSFGCFVHLDAPLIVEYLKNMKTILKPGGNAVVHYSDKTKLMAQINAGFSENTPDRMREMVRDTGFRVVEEDLTTMWHSSIIRFTH